jgi:hypothetical protein
MPRGAKILNTAMSTQSLYYSIRKRRYAKNRRHMTTHGIRKDDSYVDVSFFCFLINILREYRVVSTQHYTTKMSGVYGV